jgi:hypothetical protein
MVLDLVTIRPLVGNERVSRRTETDKWYKNNSIFDSSVVIAATKSYQQNVFRLFPSTTILKNVW